MGLVNPGEEVILFDPSYDCYRPQIQMAGGKTIGIPLRPKKSVFLYLFSTQNNSSSIKLKMKLYHLKMMIGK